MSKRQNFFFQQKSEGILHLLFTGTEIRIWGHLYFAGIAIQLYSALRFEGPKKNSKIKGNTMGFLRRSFSMPLVCPCLTTVYLMQSSWCSILSYCLSLIVICPNQDQLVCWRFGIDSVAFSQGSGCLWSILLGRKQKVTP